MNRTSRDTPGETSISTSTASKRPYEAVDSAKKTDKAKRLRVSRACDQCRAARERCDGAQPTCSTCLQAERSCSYKEQPKKRGIQPNYIRTLELSLAWLLKSNPEAERQLSELLPHSDSPAHQAIACRDVPSSDALHNLWRNGIICRQIDQMLSGADIEFPQNSHPEEVGSRAVPYQSPPLSAPSDPGLVQVEIGASNAPDSSRIVPTTGDAGVTDHERLQLPQEAWTLLEHYFAFTQTWLPITEKHDVLRLMYTYPHEGLPKTEVLESTSEHAELWAIMAWSAFCRRSLAHETDFQKYQATTRSLIPSHDLQLGHVKALLILSLIEFSQETWVASWITVGTAVCVLTYLASDMATEGMLSRGRTRHIFLAAYLLESALSAKTGALSHLRTADVQPMRLLVEDGMEEWSPWLDPTDNASHASKRQPARSISTFNELVKVALQSAMAHSPGCTGQRIPDLVSVLLTNACSSGRRRHPASLVAELISTNESAQQQSAAGVRHRSSSASRSHAQLESFDIDYWQNHGFGSLDLIAEAQHHPFMSTPSAAAGSSTTGLSGQLMAVPGSSWQTQPGSKDADGPHDFSSSSNNHSAGPSPDIFEELAILDRTDSTQNPRFMQNLGFGPDLDLAEFFGADYQPSETTFNYMQSDSFDNMPEDADKTGDGAG